MTNFFIKNLTIRITCESTFKDILVPVSFQNSLKCRLQKVKLKSIYIVISNKSFLNTVITKNYIAVVQDENDR